MFRVAKLLLYYIFAVFSAVFIVYLLLPTPNLPPQLANSLISPEPADRAFPLRPAYFTYSNRAETLEHYQNYLSRSPFKGIYLPAYRLNYPPEDSSFLVRAHMYSSYLEEIVHPFRESVFVNGFRPTQQKDDIWIYGIHYDEKITIKYIPSPLLPRVILGILTLGTLFVVIRELFQSGRILIRK